jgi:hypothetical protein
MLEELRRNVRFSGAGRALTDALMVRLANMHAWAPIEQLLAQLPAGSATPREKKKSPPAVAPRPARAERPAAGRDERAGSGVTHAPPQDVVAGIDAPRPDYTDVPQATDVLPDDEVEEMAAAGLERGASASQPVTAEERELILKDPLVQQTLELFDGAIINMERKTPTTTPQPAQPTE